MSRPAEQPDPAGLDELDQRGRAFHLLVNPISGGGAGPGAAQRVARLLREAGADVEVTSSPGQLACAAMAREAAIAGKVVVAVGGDGMLASLAPAVVEAGGLLGLVPCGRGNDFARMLGTDPRPEQAARTLLSGREHRVDVIDAGRRVVIGNVYAGFDSLASELVNRMQRVPGRLQYPVAGVRALLASSPTRFTVEVDGERVEEEAFSVVVANSGYYGAGMRVAPSASLTDGLLDVVIIRAAPKLELIRSLPRLYDGSHVGHGAVRTTRGQRVRVSSAAPLVGYGDGERLAPLPLDLRVVPGALRVLS